MRLVYLGTPGFAVPSLEALIAAGHEVQCVVTQPDRPKGRGGALAASLVKQAALAHGLDVFQPERVRRPENVARLAALSPDVMVVVGYGQILPQALIDAAPLGILNVHASVLPFYRGAAPIQWAVANGEPETGVTIMRIDAGLDTGDILSIERTAIGENETAVELSERLAPMGARLLVSTLAAYAAGQLRPEPQDHQRATLAPILKKEDGLIDWNQPAAWVHNRTRGFQPWPGAYTFFRGRKLQLWRTRILEAVGAPGSLVWERGRLRAACGDGCSVELIELQPEGKARMAGAAFANGQRVAGGERLGEEKPE